VRENPSDSSENLQYSMLDYRLVSNLECWKQVS